MPATKLTPFRIASLKPDPTRRLEIADAGARGLFLVVQPSGVKSWAVRYRLRGGRNVKHTLGSADLLSLAEARRQAAAVMAEVAAGKDPAGERRSEREAAKGKPDEIETLDVVAARHFASPRSQALRSNVEREATYRRSIAPVLGTKLVAEIGKRDVARMVDKVAAQRGEVAANRALAQLSTILRWWEDRSDTYRAPRLSGLRVVDEVPRDRVLTDDEIRRIWRAAGDAGMFGALVRFLLLTATRRNEAAHARWDEISADGSTWVIPAARYKTGADLVVPLSSAARRLLAEVPRISGTDYVFPADRGGARQQFSRNKAALDRASDTSGWALHDLRRTARSLLSRAGVSSDIAERCLGHTIGGVRGVYDKHSYASEKADAFERFARLVDAIVNPAPANVVPMPMRA